MKIIAVAMAVIVILTWLWFGIGCYVDQVRIEKWYKNAIKRINGQ